MESFKKGFLALLFYIFFVLYLDILIYICYTIDTYRRGSNYKMLKAYKYRFYPDIKQFDNVYKN